MQARRQMGVILLLFAAILAVAGASIDLLTVAAFVLAGAAACALSGILMAALPGRGRSPA